MPGAVPVQPNRSVNLLFWAESGRVFLQFRDSGAKVEPLKWGFWGGRIDPEDASPFAAAAREGSEELGLDLRPDQFRLLHERTGSDGQRSYLLSCTQRVSWAEICVGEGAGAGFFELADLGDLTLHQRLRYYLQTYPDLLRSDYTA